MKRTLRKQWKTKHVFRCILNLDRTGTRLVTTDEEWKNENDEKWENVFQLAHLTLIPSEQITSGLDYEIRVLMSLSY